ncbi:unnamed protein product [Mytilus edulis]|uniref:Transposase n=1 Tax=Mytilus edulis TaxID=6550 RepID=A0A8S3ULS2_MYTED|nr:unnamed protein product [Mytilus edulis]
MVTDTFDYKNKPVPAITNKNASATIQIIPEDQELKPLLDNEQDLLEDDPAEQEPVFITGIGKILKYKSCAVPSCYRKKLNNNRCEKCGMRYTEGSASSSITGQILPENSVPLTFFTQQAEQLKDQLDINCAAFQRLTFNDLFVELEQKVRQIRHWKGPKRTCNPLKNRKYTQSKTNRKLSLKFEFALTPMKLRFGLLFEDLADRFGISTTHASNTFTTWIIVLSSTIGALVFNPSKEAVKTNLPPSFKGTKYIDVRHIIDCTDVFLERPNNLEVAAQTWIDYKHNNTAKYLVSINPSGLIN